MTEKQEAPLSFMEQGEAEYTFKLGDLRRF